MSRALLLGLLLTAAGILLPSGCNQPFNPGCQSDYDCEDTEICNRDCSDFFGNPTTSCSSYGACVPTPPNVCTVDSDCEPAGRCIVDHRHRVCRTTVCQSDADCQGNAYCCHQYCVGGAVCDTDTDCPAGTHCGYRPCGDPIEAGEKRVCAKDSSTSCGTQTCMGTSLELLPGSLPPCCPEQTANVCGLDTAELLPIGIHLDPACQEKEQPGVPDSNCPRGKLALTLPFLTSDGATILYDQPVEGCCRPNGQCGYFFDHSTSLLPDLGCVDASLMSDAGAPQRCGAFADAGADGG
jgi:hypothetical protein